MKSGQQGILETAMYSKLMPNILKLQAICKGHKERRAFLRAKDKIIAAQALIRGGVIRRQVAEMKRQRAATVIQAAYKGFVVHSVWDKKKALLQKHKAAFKIQRSFSAFNNLKKMRTFMVAAIVIQNWYRGKLARKLSRNLRLERVDQFRMLQKRTSQLEIELENLRNISSQARSLISEEESPFFEKQDLHPSKNPKAKRSISNSSQSNQTDTNSLLKEITDLTAELEEEREANVELNIMLAHSEVEMSQRYKEYLVSMENHLRSLEQKVVDYERLLTDNNIDFKFSHPVEPSVEPKSPISGEKISTLGNQLQTVQSKLSNTEVELRRAKRKIDYLEKEKNNADKRTEANKQIILREVEEKKKAIAELCEELERTKEEKKQLFNAFIDSKGSESEVKSKQSSQFEVPSKELYSLKSKLEMQTELKNEKESTINILKSQMATQKQEIAELQEERKRNEIQIMECEENMEQLKLEIERHRKKVLKVQEDKRKSLHGQSLDIGSLRSKLSSAQAEHRGTSAKLLESELQVKSLKSEIEINVSKISDLEATISFLSSSSRGKKEMDSKLVQRLNYMSYDPSYAEAARRASDLEISNHGLVAENQRLTFERDRRDKELKDMHFKYESLKSSHSENIETLNFTCENLKRERESQKEKYGRRIKSLNEEISSLRAAIEKENNTLLSERKRNNYLEKTLAAQSLSQRNFETSNKQKSVSFQNALAARGKAENELRKIQREVKSLTSSIAEKDEEIAQLKQALGTASRRSREQGKELIKTKQLKGNAEARRKSLETAMVKSNSSNEYSDALLDSRQKRIDLLLFRNRQLEMMLDEEKSKKGNVLNASGKDRMVSKNQYDQLAALLIKSKDELADVKSQLDAATGSTMKFPNTTVTKKELILDVSNTQDNEKSSFGHSNIIIPELSSSSLTLLELDLYEAEKKCRTQEKLIDALDTQNHRLKKRLASRSQKAVNYRKTSQNRSNPSLANDLLSSKQADINGEKGKIAIDALTVIEPVTVLSPEARPVVNNMSRIERMANESYISDLENEKLYLKNALESLEDKHEILFAEFVNYKREWEDKKQAQLIEAKESKAQMRRMTNAFYESNHKYECLKKENEESEENTVKHCLWLTEDSAISMQHLKIEAEKKEEIYFKEIDCLMEENRYLRQSEDSMTEELESLYELCRNRGSEIKDMTNKIEAIERQNANTFAQQESLIKKLKNELYDVHSTVAIKNMDLERAENDLVSHCLWLTEVEANKREKDLYSQRISLADDKIALLLNEIALLSDENKRLRRREDDLEHEQEATFIYNMGTKQKLTDTNETLRKEIEALRNESEFNSRYLKQKIYDAQSKIALNNIDLDRSDKNLVAHCIWLTESSKKDRILCDQMLSNADEKISLLFDEISELSDENEHLRKKQESLEDELEAIFIYDLGIKKSLLEENETLQNNLKNLKCAKEESKQSVNQKLYEAYSQIAWSAIDLERADKHFLDHCLWLTRGDSDKPRVPFEQSKEELLLAEIDTLMNERTYLRQEQESLSEEKEALFDSIQNQKDTIREKEEECKNLRNCILEAEIQTSIARKESAEVKRKLVLAMDNMETLEEEKVRIAEWISGDYENQKKCRGETEQTKMDILLGEVDQLHIERKRLIYTLETSDDQMEFFSALADMRKTELLNVIVEKRESEQKLKQVINSLEKEIRTRFNQHAQTKRKLYISETDVNSLEDEKVKITQILTHEHEQNAIQLQNLYQDKLDILYEGTSDVWDEVRRLELEQMKYEDEIEALFLARQTERNGLIHHKNEIEELESSVKMVRKQKKEVVNTLSQVRKDLGDAESVIERLDNDRMESALLASRSSESVNSSFPALKQEPLESELDILRVSNTDLLKGIGELYKSFNETRQDIILLRQHVIDFYSILCVRLSGVEEPTNVYAMVGLTLISDYLDAQLQHMNCHLETKDGDTRKALRESMFSSISKFSALNAASKSPLFSGRIIVSKETEKLLISLSHMQKQISNSEQKNKILTEVIEELDDERHTLHIATQSLAEQNEYLFNRMIEASPNTEEKKKSFISKSELSSILDENNMFWKENMAMLNNELRRRDYQLMEAHNTIEKAHGGSHETMSPSSKRKTRLVKDRLGHELKMLRHANSELNKLKSNEANNSANRQMEMINGKTNYQKNITEHSPKQERKDINSSFGKLSGMSSPLRNSLSRLV